MKSVTKKIQMIKNNKKLMKRHKFVIIKEWKKFSHHLNPREMLTLTAVMKKIQAIKSNKKMNRNQIFLRHFDETDTKFLNLRVMLTLIAVMKKN